MCKLVTADLGSFNIKICVNKDTHNFENRFIQDNSIELFGTEHLIFENNTYIFNKGTFNKELCKTKKPFIISLLYGLSKVGVTGDINLILHLPASSILGQKQILIDALQSKEFEYICNGKNNNIRIKKLGVLKEGFSSFYSLSKRNNGLIAIMDIGGRSTEVFTFLNGQVEKEKSIALGTMDLFERIVDQLTNAGENRRLEDIQKLLDNNIISMENYQTDINNITKNLVNDIKMDIPNLSDYKIYLTGGGAEYLLEALKEHYKNVNEMQDNLFSNVLGAFEIGKAKGWNK